MGVIGAAGARRLAVPPLVRDRLLASGRGRDLAWIVGIAAAVTLAVVVGGSAIPWLAWDTGAYWDALRSAHPYEGSRVGGLGAYLYSPIFLQLLAPAGLLPWPVFVFCWTALSATAAIALLRRAAPLGGWLVPPLAALACLDIWAGNINVLLAYAMVVGMRRPGAWAFVLVTKVTPGVGLLWFAFRRQWRPLLSAAVLTAAAVAISLATSPDRWAEWAALLASEAQPGIYPEAVPLPAFARFPLAVVLVWWGARYDVPAVVPLAGFLCLPVIWVNGFAMLLGSAALWRASAAGVGTLVVETATAGGS